MSAYYTSIRKGLLIALALLAVNAGLSALAVLTGLSLTPAGIFGDLLLIQVGVLAILGGLVEFSRSKGVYEFRRLALRSREEFATTKHREASRSAVVFFSAGLVLFSVLIALALLE